MGRSPTRPTTPSKGRGGGNQDGKGKGRADQSSGGQQAAHPAILRLSGNAEQRDAFFSLLRRDYNRICHYQIYRGCDAGCPREHITKGSKQAKELFAAVSAVCPVTAL